jgi:hypothetical protein
MFGSARSSFGHAAAAAASGWRRALPPPAQRDQQQADREQGGEDHELDDPHVGVLQCPGQFEREQEQEDEGAGSREGDADRRHTIAKEDGVSGSHARPSYTRASCGCSTVQSRSSP